MRAFTYDALPMRVRFGDDSRMQLPEELDALGLHSAVVLTTPTRSSWATLSTKYSAVPVAESIRTRRCTFHWSAPRPLGFRRAGRRRRRGLCGWRVDDRVRQGDRSRLPRASVKASVMSGLNAVAHAAEGLYAPDTSPIISMMAEDGYGKCSRLCLGSLPIRGQGWKVGCSVCCVALWRGPGSDRHGCCTTSYATYSAARSTCSTPTLTPWCCHIYLAFNLFASPDARAAVQRAVGSGKASGRRCEISPCNSAVRASTGRAGNAERRHLRGGQAGGRRAVQQSPGRDARRIDAIVTDAFEGAQPDEQY